MSEPSESKESANDSFCTLPQAPCAKARDGASPDGESSDEGLGTRIYGRENCPHTRRARKALPLARFIDVEADPQALAEMLALTDGVRRIPVIVRPRAEAERQDGQAAQEVSVGFRRGS